MHESQIWFDQGVALYEKSEFRDAVTAFDKAISLNPAMAEAWNNRGLALFQMERYNDALASFDRALAINPGYQNAERARRIASDRLQDQNSGKNTDLSIPTHNLPPMLSAPPGNDLNFKSGKSVIPVLAFVLSLIIPGWGQWYTGRAWTGLKFLFIVVILNLLDYTNEEFLNKNLTLCAITWLFFLIIWLYGGFEAYTVAKRIRSGELEFTGKSRLFWIPVLVFCIGMLAFVVSIIVKSLLILSLHL